MKKVVFFISSRNVLLLIWFWAVGSGSKPDTIPYNPNLQNRYDLLKPNDQVKLELEEDPYKIQETLKKAEERERKRRFSRLRYIYKKKNNDNRK